MQYPQLPTVAFIAAFLVVIPLSSHWRARNVATLALIFWLFFADIIYGVNAIVWDGNVNDTIPVWCDITTKFTAGLSYALPLCTLCICKHLEMVSSSRKVSYNIIDRRKRMIFEGFMCIVVPLIFMALHYIVQGHRYDIIENIGCQGTIYVSIPAIFLVWFPQLLFSLITLIYAALALHNFIRRRLTFAAHVQHHSNSALTTNRFLRLVAMALTEMCWGTILTAYNLYNNVSGGLRPYTSWDSVHSHFERVHTFPMILIPKEFIPAMMVFWWSVPVSSFIFFAFFGFGQDAMKEYTKVWSWIKSIISRKPAIEKKEIPSSGGSSSRAALPRLLRLPNFKFTSTSHDAEVKSPTTSISQSTITARSPYTPRKKSLSDLTDGLPSYYESSSSPTSSTHPTLIGQLIDPKRNHHQQQQKHHQVSLPEIDESDAFTISSFSYYEGSLPSSTPFSESRSSTTASAPAVLPPTPPHPPSLRFIPPSHSLPPPPSLPPSPNYKYPRAIGSMSSLLTECGASSERTDSCSRFHFDERSMGKRSVWNMQEVPEDVESSQLKAPSVRASLGPSEVSSPGFVERVLGVRGGVIQVTQTVDVEN